MKALFIKFKNVIINFFKGIVIGIAMIVPGVSGGTLALMLGIYNEMLESINGLFKHFIKSIKFLLPILLGVLVGFLALVTPIKYGLEKCPLVIIMFFTGLIIGGIPTLYRKVEHNMSIKGIILSIVATIFMVSTCFLVKLINFSTDDLLFNLNVGLWLYLFLAGIIISAALVMPGISGSMMLMVMGLYMSVLTIIKGVMHGENITSSLLVILPIALGVLIGFFLITFIMSKLLKHCEVGTYFVIIGLVIGSLVTIFFLNFESIVSTYNTLQIVLSIVLLFIGFIASFGLDYYVNKKIKKESTLKENQDEIR